MQKIFFFSIFLYKTLDMITAELRKMRVSADKNGYVSYLLSTNEDPININSYLGQEISMNFTGKIRCVSCGKVTKKSFGQGYCYPCFISSPETEECVLKPHLCQAHVGIARDITYAEQHCLIDHYVYLAISGGLKVGVTRHTQIPTRWIDQGASQGLIIAQTPNRYLAGIIEVELMKNFSDKTNWRSMLTNIEPNINLYDERNKLRNFLQGELGQYLSEDFSIQKITYPVEKYPTKVTSLNFNKTPQISGILKGVRGQYLIFNEGRVVNLRTFTGYEVEIKI